MNNEKFQGEDMEVMVKTPNNESYAGHLNKIVEEQESAAVEASANDNSGEQRKIAEEAIKQMANDNALDEGFEASNNVTEEPKKTGLMSKFKNMFRGKELSLEEQKTKALAKWRETIMDLTHIKTVDTGLGGNAISGGIDFNQSPAIVGKLESLVDLNKKIQKTSGGEAIRMTQEKRQLITDINRMGLEEIENKFKQAA